MPWGFWATFAAALCLFGAAVGRLIDLRVRSRERAVYAGGLDAMADAHQLLGPHGNVVFSNATCRRKFDAGAVPLPNVLAGLIDGARDGAVLRDLAGAAAAGRPGRGELTLRSPGGPLEYVEVATQPLPARRGCVLWSVADVTEQKRAEAEASQRRERLVGMLEEVPVGLYSVDGEGRFAFVNAVFAGWIGAEPARLVADGVRLHQVLAVPLPADTPAHVPFADGKDAEGGRVALRGADGGPIDAFIRQRVVPEGAGLFTRSVVYSLGRDAAMTIAPDGPRLPYLLDEAPLGVALLDREGRIEACNAALRHMAADGQGCVGRPLVELVRAEDRGELGGRLDLLLAGRERGRPFHLRFAGGGERSATLFASSGEAAGRAGGLIAYFVDITEQRRLETQFAQSQKMQAVGQLAGGIAHDFNNLLTAMIGFCDLLLLRHRAGDQSFADIMQIKQNANRAASLVRQLLAFSRQQTLQPRVLIVTDVLAELSHLLRRLIGENIELEMVHGRDLYPVRVDHGQLEQVIINLAVNARDAMPNGGRLSLRTSNASVGPAGPHAKIMPPGDYALVEVIDTGTGIAPDVIDRIFDPFFSTKEVGSGTGLGLATVYGIVKQTGGFIFVDSRPGAGARFTIYLPRHAAAAGAEAQRGDLESGIGRDLTGIGTVLLVEDEDAVRLFGARALRNKGYNVLEARSGEAALEIIGSHKGDIDLMITDVVMPRMDGPTLIRKIRGLRPDMKVIFISGYAEDEFRRRVDENAEIHFLPKPFSLKQLAGKVKEVMREGEA